MKLTWFHLNKIQKDWLQDHDDWALQQADEMTPQLWPYSDLDIYKSNIWVAFVWSGFEDSRKEDIIRSP